LTRSFSAGSPVSRWGVTEELAISPEAIDLNRVALGQVRLLDSHDQGSLNAVLGVVEDARIEGANLVGRIRFADTEAGRNAEGMVARGELTGISVGYRVTTWTLTSLANEVEVWRADRWELLEVSLVAVPADPLATTRSGQVTSQRADEAHIQENDDMRRNAALSETGTVPATPPAPEGVRTVTPPAPAATPPAPEGVRASQSVDVSAAIVAERTRTADIGEIGTRAGMTQDAIASAVRDGTTVETFRARAFDHMAEQADRTRSSNVRSPATKLKPGIVSSPMRSPCASAAPALRDDAGNVRAWTRRRGSISGYGFAEHRGRCAQRAPHAGRCRRSARTCCGVP
jgi:HK97 family phage prohead protease